MTLQFEDILSAICTEVTPSHANDFQKIYALSTDVEAKLAFDVLISLGFDAKVYHTPGKPSKLYISNQAMTEEQLEQRLSAALDYVHALKDIKISLDELCSASASPLKPNNYTIAFVNAQSKGKQILIQLNQLAGDQIAVESSTSPDPNAAVPTAAAPAAVAARSSPQQAVSASSPRIAKKRRKQEKNELTTGPAVARELIYPGKKSDGTPQKETFRKRMMLQLFGNFATSGYATLIWLVVVAVLFSFMVFAKSFVCYDFVAKKSTKWYCQDQAALQAQEEARKASEKERREKLGLAPVEQQQ